MHPRRTRLHDVAEHILLSPAADAERAARRRVRAGRRRPDARVRRSARSPPPARTACVIAGEQLGAAAGDAALLAARGRRPVRLRHPPRGGPRGAARPACTPRCCPGGRRFDDAARARRGRGRLGPDHGRGDPAATRATSSRAAPSARSTSCSWSGSTRCATTRTPALARRALQNVADRSWSSRSSSATWRPSRRRSCRPLPVIERDGHSPTGRGAASAFGRVRARGRARRPDWEIFAGLAPRWAATSGSRRSTSCTRRWAGCSRPREVAARADAAPVRGDRRPRDLVLVHLPAAGGRGPAVGGRRRAQGGARGARVRRGPPRRRGRTGLADGAASASRTAGRRGHAPGCA